MTNRERIVDTALRLFNESGTGASSTNHIAQALGISPGNLYYHFPNKEAIIRAIFARLREAWAGAAALPGDRPPAPGDLRRILAAYLELVWAYRFYYRELPALVGRDPELGARFREVRREGLANVETLLRHFIAGGVMRSPGAPAGAAPDAPDAGDAGDAVPELARAIWLLADFWLPFEELGGAEVGPQDLQRGIDLILLVLRPYLAGPALAAPGAPEGVS